MIAKIVKWHILLRLLPLKIFFLILKFLKIKNKRKLLSFSPTLSPSPSEPTLPDDSPIFPYNEFDSISGQLLVVLYNILKNFKSMTLYCLRDFYVVYHKNWIMCTLQDVLWGWMSLLSPSKSILLIFKQKIENLNFDP